MASEVKTHPNGDPIKEYPKMIYPQKVIVNNAEEEAKLLGTVKEKPAGKKAGWDK